MARLHWLLLLACVLLSWLDVATDVFAITQYAELAKQQRTAAWRCTNAPVVTAWTQSYAASQQRSRHRNPFTTPACAPLATTSSTLQAAPSLVFSNPPYSFAFWMCVYLTVALLAAHLVCQAAVAMWAVRETRRAGFGDECDGCGPVLPYITAAARSLALCEPAYQSLCVYAPVVGMAAEEKELYSRHAQKVFIRSRLAELALKGPCVTVAAFALLLQLVTLSSSSSQLYTPPGAFSSSRSVATLPLVATALSFGVGVLSLAVFCSAYAVSQRQSLWGGAKPVQTRGFAKTAVFASATGLYCACSAVCRAVVIASSIASIMLDDNIGRPAFYLVIGGLVALLAVGWTLYSHCCVCGGQARLLDCMSCVRGAYCALVSSFTVNMPWNTSAATYHRETDRSTAGGSPSGDGGSSGGGAAGVLRQQRSSGSSRMRGERRWWPVMAFTGVSALSLLATALLLALLVGSEATCYAVCSGHVSAQGRPQGYVFFSVPAGLLVAVLVVAEVLLFVLLSRTAPKRRFDDDWDDEFIELDPQAGKVPI